ncbi:MAG TPA: hypothetical protein VGC82_19440, partial [Rhodopila sp.]
RIDPETTSSVAHGWHVAAPAITRNGFRQFHRASAVGRSVVDEQPQPTKPRKPSISPAAGGAAMDTVQAKACRNHTASVESRMKTAFIAGRQNWHRDTDGKGPSHRIQCRLVANRPNIPSAPDRSKILLRGTLWHSFFLRVENKEG